ncbi:MAG: ankyrin repeat domain-containing protein [Gemmatimonadales bacterium]|jgi:ankyrin repeat protein
MKITKVALLTVSLLAPSLAGRQEPSAPTVSLHTAAFHGDLAAVTQHIAAGSDLDARDAYGSTPLTVAATFDKSEVARALIEAGADLDIANNDGGTALHAAAFLCRTEIVDALLAAGANKYRRDHFGNTPLESVTAPFEAATIRLSREMTGRYRRLQLRDSTRC